MRIPPFSYIADYFRTRSEERRNKLKAEILSELLPALDDTKEDLVKTARKELFSIVDRFDDALGQKRKGLESQMKELRNDVRIFESKSRNAVDAAKEVKKNSERLTAVASDAKKEADVVVESIKAMDEIVKRAEEAHKSIDETLERYTGIAVERCTAVVKTEMDKAVQEARKEYKINIDDHRDKIDEENSKRMFENSKKLEGIAKSGIDEFKKECQSVIDALKNECRTDLDAYKKVFAELRSDYQKLTPRLDVAAQKFRKLEEQINRFDEAMQGRPLYLVAATLLGSVKRKQLRELYGPEFKGDASRYKKSLEAWRDSQLKGKKVLSPAELEIEYVPRAFDDLLGVLKAYDRDEVYILLDMAEFIDGINKSNQAGNSRPGSGRYNKH